MSILVSTYTISTLTPPSAQFSSDATGSHQAQLPQAQASRDLGGKSASDTGGDAATATSPGNRLIASESVTITLSATAQKSVAQQDQALSQLQQVIAQLRNSSHNAAAARLKQLLQEFRALQQFGTGLGPGAGRAGQTNQRCSGRSESRRRKRSHIDD